MQKRTDLFSSLGKDPDLERYRSLLTETLPTPAKLLETIYNCEFLGFLDEEEKRVGCLLHPSMNHGVDLRRDSFYGVDLCAGHFCPSFTYLTTVEQKAVILTLDDWYLYGLAITDIDFIKEFFKHVQNRLGESVRPERLQDVAVRKALRSFLVLKESWKFSSKKNRLGKYFFSHSEYQIARIEYEKNWKIKPSRFDKILVSLSSEFDSADEMREAESLIEEAIGKFIDAYQGASR